MDQDQTQQLGIRFRNGEVAAYEQLYLLHAQALVRYLQARGPVDLAEELAQDAWVKAWERREQFVGGTFRGWIFTIARNALIDVQRRPGSRQTQLDPSVVDPVDPRQLNDLQPRTEELAALRDCMERLSVRLHTVIQKVKIAQETREAVAEVIGTSRGQIDKDVHRAKKQLRDCLEKKMS